MRRRDALRVTILTIAMLIATSLAHAQSGDNLREAAQNPIANLISLPFQNNTNFGVGHSTTPKTFSTFSRSSRSASIRTGT
jgi:hypothetical protein